MNFDLDDDQRDLAAAAADFLRTTTPALARAALDDGSDPADPPAPLGPGRAGWIESGFAAITVPESAGGGGGTVLDLAVVAEQAGRVLAGPSLVGYARAAVLLADDAPRLAALADGSAAYAVLDDSEPTLDATSADTFLWLAPGPEGSGGAAPRCGPGTVEARAPKDPTRGLGRVTPGEGEAVRCDIEVPQRWEHALRVGRVVLAAEGLGAASRALETAVAYAKERHAFGRAIGSYQAIKHSLVDAYVEIENLRSLVWWSAWAADQSPDELPLAAAAAKAAASAALIRASETSIQVHGGIGFTWEHDAHLYWRRAHVDRYLLGDDVAAYDEVARLALAGAER